MNSGDLVFVKHDTNIHAICCNMTACKNRSRIFVENYKNVFKMKAS
jgi:hypothetical protein